MRAAFFALTIIIMGLLAAAQTTAQTRSEVYIAASGNDEVGRRLVYALRELLASSALFVERTVEGVLLDEISVISLDTDADNPGVRSAASVMFTVIGICESRETKGRQWIEAFTTHSVLLVGRQRTESVAKGILADFSAYFERLARRYTDCAIRTK